MKKEIFIEVAGYETRMLVMEDNEPLDIFIERRSQGSLIGNMYLGRVQRLSRGINAAFVDIGEKKSGFLPLREESLLNEGELIRVQVTRDAYKTKGPQLTRELSIAGRFLVYKSSGNNVSVSKRILEVSEKQRLLSILNCERVQEECLIARTLSAGANETEILNEVDKLRGLWNHIEMFTRRKTHPGIFHREISPVMRALRDHLTENLCRVIISGADKYTATKKWFLNFAPELSHILESYNGEVSLFDNFRVQKYFDNLLENRIALPSGGNIVIESTEALTVIDVNSGTNLDGNSQQDNAFITNIEAARECCRQIRLRNISGIIVIDFIRSANVDMWLEITNTIKELLAKDRVLARVLGKTDAGLFEIIRKRSNLPLMELTNRPCKVCDGSGVEAQPEFSIFSIIAELRQMRSCHQGNMVLVEASSDIIKCLQSLYSSGEEMAKSIGVGCILDYKVNKDLPLGKYLISYNYL